MKLTSLLFFALAGIGLLLVIVPSLLVFTSIVPLGTSKTLMLIGTVIWFAAALLRTIGARK